MENTPASGKSGTQQVAMATKLEKSYDETDVSRTLVTQTLKGDEKQFKLAEVQVIGVD